MMRKLAGTPGLVFGLVVVWKLALFAFTAQPIPLCDSFFYDGAVVNLLNGGRYCNPSLALVLPISGTEVFSAYPPLYQVVLYGWMCVFGTSAWAAMALHQVLFVLYVLVLFGIFQRLKTPALWVNGAGLFLFVNTFHDRPDSLAILLGVGAIYAWVRAQDPTVASARSGPAPGAAVRGSGWNWLAAGLIVLTLATNLQFGGIYLGCLWVLALANAALRRARIPWGPLAATILIPAVLVVFVKFGHPRLWEGFQEHATRSPGVTSFRLPNWSDTTRALRTLPGFGLAVVLGAGLWWQRRERVTAWFKSVDAMVWLGMVAAVLVFTIAALTFLSSNSVLAAGYLQPLVIGLLLGAFANELPAYGRKWLWPSVFVALAAVCALRAVGMTTWGVACAADVSHGRAVQLVRQSLNELPPGATVAVSAGFLYEAVQHQELRVLHSDWLTPPDGGGVSRAEAVATLKPAKLILTQFDHYRLYGEAIAELQSHTNLVHVNIINTAGVPVPDAALTVQKVVQNISWAPVIVEFSWK